MRVAVLVDYWNFQLTLNQRVAAQAGLKDAKVKVDWKGLGPTLIEEACKVLSTPHSESRYEGTYIFTSYNPKTAEGAKFKSWATSWLDRQPGVNVEIRERKPKAAPHCPTCHATIDDCPHCQAKMIGTVEKGVDTLIATTLIRLAIQDSYDVAILASLDADMIPAVEFVQERGKKVIQAGFPPFGVDLATQCWGSFDVMARLQDVQRS